MTQRFKILSDFDGVWTDPRAEAQVLLQTLVTRVADLLDVSEDDARRALADMSEAMRTAPGQHGWAPDGRLSAFIDEDPLLETSSLCRLFDQATDGHARSCKDAVRAAGFASLHEFSETVFREGTARYREQHEPCMVPNAKARLERLRDAGADVVVISNSAPDKLIAWFRESGIDAREDEGGDVRVRGSAAKWLLGPGHDTLTLGERTIFVDRPRYRAAIEAENPDLIIGDVFSLDLAMPSVMRRDEHPAAPRYLALRRHPHTPPWVLDTARNIIDFVVDAVDDLAPHIAENTAKR